MTPENPQSLREFWHALDKRLALIEESLRQHRLSHASLEKCLDDHEQRLRKAGNGALLSAGVTSLLSTLALIKAFLRP